MKFEKDIKNSIGANVYTFGITRAGKGQPFNWKPEVCPHWDSLHSISYSKDGMYNTISYYVPMYCQIFWLGLIFYIKVWKKELGSHRMINYEDTVNDRNNALLKRDSYKNN